MTYLNRGYPEYHILHTQIYHTPFGFQLSGVDFALLNSQFKRQHLVCKNL